MVSSILKGPGLPVSGARPTQGRMMIRTMSLSSGTQAEVYFPTVTHHLRQPVSMRSGVPGYVFPSVDSHYQVNAKGSAKKIDVMSPFEVELSEAEKLANSFPLQAELRIVSEGGVSRPGSSALSYEVPLGVRSREQNPKISLAELKIQAAMWTLYLSSVSTQTSNPDLFFKGLEEAWTLIQDQTDQALEAIRANPESLAAQLDVLTFISELENLSSEVDPTGQSFLNLVRQARSNAQNQRAAASHDSAKTLFGIGESRKEGTSLFGETTKADVPEVKPELGEDKGNLPPDGHEISDEDLLGIIRDGVNRDYGDLEERDPDSRPGDSGTPNRQGVWRDLPHKRILFSDKTETSDETDTGDGSKPQDADQRTDRTRFRRAPVIDGMERVGPPYTPPLEWVGPPPRPKGK